MLQLKEKSKRINQKQFLIGWFFIWILLGGSYPNMTTIIQGAYPSSTNTNILPEQTFSHEFQEVGQYLDRYGALSNVVLQGEIAFVASYWGGVINFQSFQS